MQADSLAYDSLAHTYDGEIADPEHLDPEDRQLVAEITTRVAAGESIEEALNVLAAENKAAEILEATEDGDYEGDDDDDPNLRALIHGHLLRATVQDPDGFFPDPDSPEAELLYPQIESVEANRQIEKFVRQTYPETMAALEDGLMWLEPESKDLGDVRPPTLEETIAILSNGLTREQIEFAMRKMREPKLILKPKTSFRRYVIMLDNGKRLAIDGNVQGPTIVNKERLVTFETEDRQMGFQDNRIIGWDVGIIEGEEELGCTSGTLFDHAMHAMVQQTRPPKGVVIASPREWALLLKLSIMADTAIKLKNKLVICRSDLDGSIIEEDGLISTSAVLYEGTIVFIGIEPSKHMPSVSNLRHVVMAKKFW